MVREERNGVVILRSRIYVPEHVNSVRRILHEASFTIAALLRVIGQRRPDLMMVVSPPLALAFPAVILSRLWRIPYVFHVPDLQPDAAVDLGMLPEGRLTRTLYRIEKLAYRNAALVSTLTEAMRQRIVSKGIAADKVKLIADWAAPDLFAVPLEGGGGSFRLAHGLNGMFVTLHCGNMGVKQGLGVALGAAELSHGQPDVGYLLVGDGAARPALEARAAASALSNVRFMPLQSQLQFIDLLAATDAALITQQRVVADIVFPSKVLTLMAAGRALIASVNAGSEVARVVREANAGVVVEPENPRALLEAITALHSEPAKKRAMGICAREYARARWDRDRILAQTAAELTRVANRSSEADWALASDSPSEPAREEN
jgi:colanic acid biosynthesis glycosyl transferase WcaI